MGLQPYGKRNYSVLLDGDPVMDFLNTAHAVTEETASVNVQPDEDDYVMNETEQAALENYYKATRNETVEQRLDRIETAVKELDTKLSTILELVDGMMAQAGPVIKQIADSPMVKMLTGGK